MARMADRVLCGGLYYPRWVTGDRLVQVKPSNLDAYVGNRLREAQIIDASNVADYYYLKSGQTDWDPYHDFPNVAPPFPLFWVEMRRPQTALNDSIKKKLGCLPFAFGCLPCRVGGAFPGAGISVSSAWACQCTLHRQHAKPESTIHPGMLPYRRQVGWNCGRASTQFSKGQT